MPNYFTVNKSLKYSTDDLIRSMAANDSDIEQYLADAYNLKDPTARQQVRSFVNDRLGAIGSTNGFDIGPGGVMYHRNRQGMSGPSVVQVKDAKGMVVNQNLQDIADKLIYDHAMALNPLQEEKPTRVNGQFYTFSTESKTPDPNPNNNDGGGDDGNGDGDGDEDIPVPGEDFLPEDFDYGPVKSNYLVLDPSKGERWEWNQGVEGDETSQAAARAALERNFADYVDYKWDHENTEKDRNVRGLTVTPEWHPSYIDDIKKEDFGQGKLPTSAVERRYKELIDLYHRNPTLVLPDGFDDIMLMRLHSDPGTAVGGNFNSQAHSVNFQNPDKNKYIVLPDQLYKKDSGRANRGNLLVYADNGKGGYSLKSMPIRQVLKDMWDEAQVPEDKKRVSNYYKQLSENYLWNGDKGYASDEAVTKWTTNPGYTPKDFSEVFKETYAPITGHLETVGHLWDGNWKQAARSYARAYPQTAAALTRAEEKKKVERNKPKTEKKALGGSLKQRILKAKEGVNLPSYNDRMYNLSSAEQKALEENIDETTAQEKLRKINKDNKSMANPDAGLNKHDMVRIGTAAADLAAVVTGLAGFTPASAGIGLTSTVTGLVNDLTDDSVTVGEAFKGAGLSLATDAVSLIPGASVSKVGKIIKTLGKIAAPVGMALSAMNMPAQYEAFKRVTSGKDWTTDDLRLVLQGLTAITGAGATAYKGARNFAMKPQKVSNKLGIDVTDAKGKKRTLLIEGEEDVQALKEANKEGKVDEFLQARYGDKYKADLSTEHKTEWKRGEHWYSMPHRETTESTAANIRDIFYNPDKKFIWSRRSNDPEYFAGGKGYESDIAGTGTYHASVMKPRMDYQKEGTRNLIRDKRTYNFQKALPPHSVPELGPHVEPNPGPTPSPIPGPVPGPTPKPIPVPPEEVVIPKPALLKGPSVPALIGLPGTPKNERFRHYLSGHNDNPNPIEMGAILSLPKSTLRSRLKTQLKADTSKSGPTIQMPPQRTLFRGDSFKLQESLDNSLKAIDTYGSVLKLNGKQAKSKTSRTVDVSTADLEQAVAILKRKRLSPAKKQLAANRLYDLIKSTGLANNMTKEQFSVILPELLDQIKFKDGGVLGKDMLRLILTKLNSYGSNI